MENRFDINTLVKQVEKVKDKGWNIALVRFASFFLSLYKTKASNLSAWEKCYDSFLLSLTHKAYFISREDNAYFASFAKNEHFQNYENMLFDLAREDFSTALEFLAFDLEQKAMKDAFPDQCAEIEIARKMRKEQELEEKALLFLKANFEKYHNVYKALA